MTIDWMGGFNVTNALWFMLQLKYCIYKEIWMLGWSKTFIILDYHGYTIKHSSNYLALVLILLRVLEKFYLTLYILISALYFDWVLRVSGPELSLASTESQQWRGCWAKLRDRTLTAQLSGGPHTCWPGWCLPFLRSKLHTWCQLYFQETSQFSVPSLQTNLLRKH